MICYIGTVMHCLQLNLEMVNTFTVQWTLTNPLVQDLINTNPPPP